MLHEFSENEKGHLISMNCNTLWNTYIH